MHCDFDGAHYSSVAVQDTGKGVAGLELHCTRQGRQDRIAEIMFWDASGQFVVKTFNSEVPLEVLEELIAEAKETIKTK